MTARTQIRENARLALRALPALASFTEVSLWHSVDAKTLPVFAVATPREDPDRDELRSTKRVVTLQVEIKMLGASDTIEATLDALAPQVEARICASLDTAGFGTYLETLATPLEGGGEQIVGSLIMTFRAHYRTGG